ncbi:unnamed protein product [Lota lota]
MARARESQIHTGPLPSTGHRAQRGRLARAYATRGVRGGHMGPGIKQMFPVAPASHRRSEPQLCAVSILIDVPTG